MMDFVIRRQVAADVSEVWALLDDSASWPEWTPLDAHEPVSPPGPDGVGEVRLFHTGRYTMREQIIERRPETHLVYTLLAGLAVRDYRAEIDLRAVPAPEDAHPQDSDPGGGLTEVTWHTTFRPKIPGSGWLYRRSLRSATQNFVDGLAERFEGSRRDPAGAAE